MLLFSSYHVLLPYTSLVIYSVLDNSTVLSGLFILISNLRLYLHRYCSTDLPVDAQRANFNVNERIPFQLSTLQRQQRL